MTLRRKVLQKANVPEIRMKIALTMGVSERTVIRWFADNEHDGDLTKKTVLTFLSKELSIPEINLTTTSKAFA